MPRNFSAKCRKAKAFSPSSAINLKLLYSDIKKFKVENGMKISEVISRMGLKPPTFYSIFQNPNYDIKFSQLQDITKVLGKSISDYLDIPASNARYAWPYYKSVNDKNLPNFNTVEGFRELYASASYVYTWLYVKFPGKVAMSIDYDRSVSLSLSVTEDVSVVLKMTKYPTESRGSALIHIDNSRETDKSIFTKKAFTFITKDVVKDFLKIYKRELIKYGQ